MIANEDVKHIASLARLHIGEDELSHFAADLEKILGYIDQLTKLDISKTKPTSHVLPIQNIYRKDEIHPSLSPDKVLSLTSWTGNGAFKVPQVIE